MFKKKIKTFSLAYELHIGSWFVLLARFVSLKFFLGVATKSDKKSKFNHQVPQQTYSVNGANLFFILSPSIVLIKLRAANAPHPAWGGEQILLLLK